MKKSRIAAIDIGSNSIRCIIAETCKESSFKVLDDEKATVRLGEQLAITGRISDEAAGRAIEVIQRFRKLITGLKVESVEAVATSAVRTASNGNELVAALSRELGFEVTVITGEEEAELSASSALSNFDMDGKRYAMVDIGGGSVEIVTACGKLVEELFSLDLGAVVMTDRFLKNDPIDTDQLEKLQRHIRTILKRTFGGKKISADSFIGSGGILRLADGLDRRRNSVIQSTRCQFGGTNTIIHLTANEDVSVEIFGANSKKELFEKAFGCAVVFATA